MARKATVTLNRSTLATEWNGVEVGKAFKLRIDGEVIRFVASSIEPTFPGSAFAWMTGKRVNGHNKPIAQISHLHCPAGERRELVNVGALVK